MPELTAPTRPRRRWFRFSLRSLLVVTAIVGLLLGWIVSQRMQSAHELKIAQELDRQGWAIGYEGLLDAYVPGQGQRAWRDLARWIIGERVIEVDTVELTVSELALVAELPSLKSLIANHTQIADLTPLAKLERLEMLQIGYTKVGDVTSLEGLTSLKDLEISGTRIVDLKPLRGLTNLQQLHIYHTQIPHAQIDALQTALPNCKIVPAP